MAQGIANNPEAERLRRTRIGLAQKGIPKSREAVEKQRKSLTGKYLGDKNPNFKGVRTLKTCIECGAEFLGRYGNPEKNKGLNKYCSKDCKWSSMGRIIGKDHPRYKDGTYSHGNRNYKYGSAHIKWRKAVLERDKYTCVLCGDKYKELHVDHIKPFKDYPALRYDVDNGRVLCKYCHYEITFSKSPLNNWKAYSRWAKVTRGKQARAVQPQRLSEGTSQADLKR